jgi:hypothetical protein
LSAAALTADVPPLRPVGSSLPPPVLPASEPPPAKPIRPANFPPPPGFSPSRKSPQGQPAAPKPSRNARPEGGRKSSLTLLLLLLLVVAAAGYIYLADPLGLFQTAPVIAPPPSQPTPAEPVAPEPAPAPTVAPEPSPSESAPEHAPALNSAPAEPEPAEPEPPPPPLPELRNVVSAIRITGARANGTGGIVMIGTTTYQPGEVIDPIKNLTFVGFADGVMTFRDERGALYTRRF